jgi:S-adenosylmethionine:tRNA ribosyltransferase-isomerase
MALTSDFAYVLPPDRIAQEPVPRGEARMLVLDAKGTQRHRQVHELPGLLRPDDLLVVNDTRVIPARLFGRAIGGGPGGLGAGAMGGPLELLLLERTGGSDWICLARPGRRARLGARLLFASGLDAEVLAKNEDGRVWVRFAEPVEPHLDRIGHVPLPPYIHRPDEPADRERYQTVFACHPGAIAAPTAGLHFSAELLAALGARGVEVQAITLHVGIGTFRPVTTPEAEQHRMEKERFAVSAETAAAIHDARTHGRRVVAVGTTVVRALEGAAAAPGTAGAVAAGEGKTGLFITPGFRFQVVDVLLTNFHLPCSTLLMLVCAFAGRERVLAAYAEAIAEGYRFYSYGDAMLLQRRHTA